ncbi:MAG: Porin [uncultured Thiotrichaceae bacterium]|uniref:Porin n=1 Tax=uncultured Thiotrichaceae bacterium TaxID=298394 RepID=A0A6S6T8P6_9GAMM|nr:MAG: Porin [uncultured Thiotrichaceae bacterium]
MLSSLLVLSCFSSVIYANETTNTTSVSGLLEIEVSYNDAASSSDINLATLELATEHRFNEKVDAQVLFLYEEGENDDNIAIDEATINVHPNNTTNVSAGRMYVPFGKFESMMVSDPQTLELAETQEEAILLAKQFGNITATAYVFKDDEDASDKIDDGGISLDYETDGFMTGISYISDVNNKSNANTQASGTAIYAVGTRNQLSLIAEHIALDTTSDGEKPKATNFEVGFDFGNDRAIAASYQTTSNALAAGLPKNATGLAYSMPVYDNTQFAAEYMQTENYAGENDKTVTLQVAYEF